MTLHKLRSQVKVVEVVLVLVLDAVVVVVFARYGHSEQLAQNH